MSSISELRLVMSATGAEQAPIFQLQLLRRALRAFAAATSGRWDMQSVANLEVHCAHVVSRKLTDGGITFETKPTAGRGGATTAQLCKGKCKLARAVDLKGFAGEVSASWRPRCGQDGEMGDEKLSEKIDSLCEMLIIDHSNFCIVEHLFAILRYVRLKIAVLSVSSDS